MHTYKFQTKSVKLYCDVMNKLILANKTSVPYVYHLSASSYTGIIPETVLFLKAVAQK